MEKNNRPNIDDISNGDDLKRWYWLKDELIAKARAVGVKSTGGKFIILDRLAYFLDTGEHKWPGDKKSIVGSKFNWHNEPLSLQTKITDSYKNSQNVRRFFKKHVGKNFKFNIAFMDWIKSAEGKTLADAVEEYHRLSLLSADSGIRTKIKPHNQFNQYMRDILAANPGMKTDEARLVWKLKRALPSETGRHVYAPSDLDL